MATNPKFTDISQVVGTDFDNADGASLKTLLTAGSGGTRIEAMSITTDEAGDNDLMLYINDGSLDHPVGHLDIPALSGTDGAKNVINGLNSTNLPWTLIDAGGNRYFNIPSGHSIKAGMKTTVTATETVNVVVVASNY